MKQRILPVVLLLTVSVVALAQTQLSSWPFYAEVSPTETATAGVYKFTVPFHIMGQSRDDLGDLRLFDASNHEIPYAILVREERNDTQDFETRIFNNSTIGKSSEVTIDVGENAADHNEVEIHTTGMDFRRRVSIEGSDSGSEWRTLRTDAVIFGFQSEGKSVESSRVTYPTSRYRYLRVRVMADEFVDDEGPVVTDVKVKMAVHEKGYLSAWDVDVPSYQLLRNQGAHASSWLIDFGSRLPCSRLTLAIGDSSFYRPFQVETFDDAQHPELVASGNLSRRSGENVEEPKLITFDREVHVRKIRLQITDYSNQTLSINSMQAAAAAREIVFELKQPQNSPVRLFYGNSQIPQPHYDFEKEISAKLRTEPTQTKAGNAQTNPAYVPEPKPFSERVPWLIYVVLAVSSAALGWILWSLARTTLRREPQDNATS